MRMKVQPTQRDDVLRASALSGAMPPRVSHPHDRVDAVTSRSSALTSSRTTSIAFEDSNSSNEPRTWRAGALQVACSLLLILRSACISVAFAWVAMLCFSAGNIFSGKSRKLQSTREFKCALLLWSKLVSWLCVAANSSATLMSQRFAASPDAKPTFIVCWMKVVRGSSPLFALSSVVTLAVAVALLHVPDSTRYLHLEFYITVVWYHLDTVACHVEASRVFDDETVRGLAKQRACSRQRPRYWKQLLHVFVATLSGVSSYVVASVYAHVMSRLVLDTPSQLLMFTFASFALKIALQEVAKCNVFKQKIQSVAIMASIVGIPTILIDTQMRLVLLLAKSTSATLTGTLGMALIEVAMRCAKAFYVKYQIKRERARRAAQTSVTATALPSKRAANTTLRSDMTRSPTASTAPAQATTLPGSGQPFDAFNRWRVCLLHYHATEVYIDMFAEYVALGCSYVILFFCWNHPKYMLRRFHDSSAASDLSSTIGNSSSSGGIAVGATTNRPLSSVLSGSQAIIMVCQLSAEIAVDFASCLIEVGNGIDFRPLQRQSFFLSLLVVWAATGNLAISANMYLQE